MESLANNHPFVDGNKRVAFYVTDAFLRMNGYYINCEDEAAYEYFMALFEAGMFRYAALETWLEEHVEILPTFN